jgi:hypothetical protein
MESTMPVEKIIWLASYPRSGNTWLRVILNQLMAPHGSPFETIGTFDGKQDVEVPRFELGSGWLSVVKTHTVPGAGRMGRIRTAYECAGLITIHRHPLDVMLSAINFARYKKNAAYFKDQTIRTVEEIIRRGEISYYADEFCRADGMPGYAAHCKGLSGHQERWNRFGRNVPHLRICYEDMVARPKWHIEALHEFFRLKSSSEAIDRIADAADRQTALDGRFYWRKRAFNFAAMGLPGEAIARFCKRYESTLAYLGYSASVPPASDEPGRRESGPWPKTVARGRIDLRRFVAAGSAMHLRVGPRETASLCD